MKNKILLYISVGIGILIIGTSVVCKNYLDQESQQNNSWRSLLDTREEKKTDPKSEEDIRSSLITEYNLTDLSQYSNINSDCLGYNNDNPSETVPGGGDIIFALQNDTFRSLISINVFTLSYIKNIGERVRSEILGQHNKDIFVVYICHLGENLDLLTGYLGTPTDDQEKLRSYRTNKPEQPAVIIVNNNNVHIFKGVRTRVGNATGGEGAPCGVRLVENNIEWKCFLELGIDEATQITFPKYENWLFSRNGKILENWKSVE